MAAQFCPKPVCARSGARRPLYENSCVLPIAYYMLAIGLHVWDKKEANVRVCLLQRACAEFCTMAQSLTVCSVRGFVQPSRNAIPGPLSVEVLVLNVCLRLVGCRWLLQVCLVGVSNYAESCTWFRFAPGPGSRIELLSDMQLRTPGVHRAGHCTCGSAGTASMSPHRFESARGQQLAVGCGDSVGASELYGKQLVPP